MGKIVFGMILGLILAPVIVLAWFHYGNPPVAVRFASARGEDDYQRARWRRASSVKRR